MPQAPLPETLPGDFFVLEYDRDLGRYLLHVDDADGKSFRLPGSVPRIQLQFRQWGLDKRLSDDVIDAAREFGAVQCIPAQRRVINLIDRHPGKTAVEFHDEEKTNAAAYL